MVGPVTGIDGCLESSRIEIVFSAYFLGNNLAFVSDSWIWSEIQFELNCNSKLWTYLLVSAVAGMQALS